MRVGPFLLLLILSIVRSSGQSVFINEIHYDNESTDTGEAVEIVAPTGTDLSAYELLFYNGASGDTYGSIVLSGTTPNQSNSGFGAIAFPFEGIQNGAPDALCLYHPASSTIVQFLSYEGVMTATGGVASGETSEDIGVTETASTASGTSLQLTGDGSDYGDFTWTRGAAASFGTINAGQSLDGGGISASLTLTLSQSRLVESATAPIAARLQVSPAPEQTEVYTITVRGTGDLKVPGQITTDATGTAVFLVSANDNAIDEGDRTFSIMVADATGERMASARLTVVDDDRMPLKGEAVRVAAFNLLNDVGDRGSTGFNAVAESLSRIEPDVIAFQEVDSINGFQPLQRMLEDIAFATDGSHFATVDDSFSQAPYNGGDFNSGEQSLAIASRYPIKRVVQIGRDVPDARREITRFPLYAEIDIPWAEDADDLHVICVHYKAGTRDSDRFRKAVEAYRTLEFLASEGISAETHNVIVLGDFNENAGNFQPSSFNTGRTTFGDGSAFPNGFAAGDDISGAGAVTLPYDSFPANLFGEQGYKIPSARHADRRGANTFIEGEDVRLDYIVLSDRLNRNGNRFTEIFNSEVDVDFEGLPKQGQPVKANASRAASDHYPLFGDYWMEPKNRITVSFSTASPSLDEASDETIKGSVVLTPALADGEQVTVTLSDQFGDLVFPSSVTIVGPGNSADFQVAAATDGRADRSRTIALIAEADGYATGYGGILVENRDASGILLISQMLHATANGTRAIEIVNATTDPISFGEMPLELRVFSNGSRTAATLIRIDQDGLDPGEVLVLGNAAFAALAGDIEFRQEALDFDGNDAIEIVSGGVRSDVFGQIGENPGTAWEGDGATTRNANLILRSTIGIGSRGWGNPSLRFTASPSPDATDFGIPPALDDPYVTWIESFGLTRNADGHPDADPDSDQLTNAGEFAFLTDPKNPDRHAATTGPSSRDPIFVRRPDDGRVLYFLGSSGDLDRWDSEPYSILELTNLPNGRQQIKVSSNLRILRSEHYYRFEAILP
jgi:endonuclease/exonuclease/phosphatase family metal-dependent hydrolase